jgi:hypothetical protein
VKPDTLRRRTVTTLLYIGGFLIVGMLLGAVAAKASKMYMEVGR